MSMTFKVALEKLELIKMGKMLLTMSESMEPVPTTMAPPVAPLAPAELDESGLPWDKRIHASTKTKKKDGCWKAKKGVDPGLVVDIETTLRGNSPAPQASQEEKNVVFMALMQKITGLTTPPEGSTIPLVALPAITAIAVKHGAVNIPALLQGPIETIQLVTAEVEALCLTLQ